FAPWMTPQHVWGGTPGCRRVRFAGTALLILVSFAGVRPSRSLVAAQRRLEAVRCRRLFGPGLAEACSSAPPWSWAYARPQTQKRASQLCGLVSFAPRQSVASVPRFPGQRGARPFLGILAQGHAQ